MHTICLKSILIGFLLVLVSSCSTDRYPVYAPFYDDRPFAEPLMEPEPFSPKREEARVSEEVIQVIRINQQTIFEAVQAVQPKKKEWKGVKRDFDEELFAMQPRSTVMDYFYNHPIALTGVVIAFTLLLLIPIVLIYRFLFNRVK